MIFRCTNCLWEGTLEDMSHDSCEYWCPNCLAQFHTDGEEEVGPWEVVEICEDEEDEDYGEFDL